ncbi:hypothetical protein GCM10009557_15460 [Virgisporangium ochraceum]|uniref:Uncharacterized protein n=1 Tax=Virgisporangium ochraceum TaxID=65505 RepID=A0A8J3ZUX0_9ACTN|nr:hypothetical protein [Virgisporangium ochraceum]GIJ67940.1 hypothetical protein Voc01_028570 [Virgisporangium ochraceum]
MNTGELLDEAAAAIARATVALRGNRPDTPDEQAAVAVARTRLYRELEQHVGLLGNADTGLAASLHDATAAVRAAMPAQLPHAPSAGPVSRALHNAVVELVTVNGALAEHLGTAHGRPQTPEGAALRAGHGRADNLAAAARLIAAAVELDTRLRVNGWLRPGPDAGSWQPLLIATSADVTRTEQGDLAVHALLAAARGNAADAPSRHVSAVAVTGDRPLQWTQIPSSNLVVDAMDAVRSALYTSDTRLTARETARIARSALMINYQVGHVLSHTTALGDKAAGRARRAVTQWRNAAEAADLLRSPIDPPPGGHTADNALRAVSDWFSRHLGPPGDWRPIAKWPMLRPGQDWQTLATDVAARLPEIALLMVEQVGRTQEASEFLRAAALHRQPGKSIYLARWERAPTDDPVYTQLCNALRNAFNAGSKLAEFIGAKRPVGVLDAVKALRDRGERTTVRSIMRNSYATPPAAEPRSQSIEPASKEESPRRHR